MRRMRSHHFSFQWVKVARRCFTITVLAIMLFPLIQLNRFHPNFRLYYPYFQYSYLLFSCPSQLLTFI